MTDRFQLGRDILARQQTAAEEASRRRKEREQAEKERSLQKRITAFDLTPQEAAELRGPALDLPTTSSESAVISSATQPAIPTRNEPSVQEEAPGSPPSGSPSGGVLNTVARTEKKVNRSLGTGGDETQPPTLTALRRASAAYQQGLQDLKNQGVDVSDTEEQLRAVRAAYREKADRNELLSLVQMVAQSFGKLAAYQYGQKTGRYIADQVNVPGVDYESRTDRAMREAQVEAGDIETVRKARESAAAQDRSLQERIAQARKEDIDVERYYEEEAARDRRAAESERRQEARTRASEKRDAEREKGRTAAASRQDALLEYKDAQRSESLLDRINTSLDDPKELKTKDLSGIADQVGVSEEEKKAAYDVADADTLIGKPSQADINAALLPVLRKKIGERRAALAAQKESALSTIRGVSTPEGTPPPATPSKVIKSRIDGATRPYTDALWQQIQASPKRDQYEIVGG